MDALAASTTTVRVILDEVERRGLDGNALLAERGLARRAVFNPLGRLPRSQILDLVRGAQALCNDPSVHVAAALNSAPGAFSVADHMTLTAPSIGEGYARILKRFHLVNPAMAFDIDERPERVVVRVRPVHVVASDPIEVEATFAALTVRLHQMTGGAHAPLEVRLAYSSTTPDLADRLQCSVVYEAAENEIAFARAAWSARSELANPSLSELLFHLSEPLLRETRLAPELARIERALVQSVTAGQFDMVSVARLLGTSARTLQRRLSELGTSFSAKLDGVRRSLASRALRDGTESITQIGLMLGFSETSAFSRAFRRWTGRSPTQYQQAVEKRRDE